MIETYTKENALKLVEFYKPLLHGKIIEESTQGIINDVNIEGVGNSLFRVNAKAPIPNRTTSTLTIAIEKVAALHKLVLPLDYLKKHG